MATSDEKVSLNNQYGSRCYSLLTSLSMLLNTGLMIYAHIGLSAVIYSSQPPTSEELISSPVNNALLGSCSTADLDIFFDGGGTTKEQLDFCGREYGENGCLLDSTCTVECMQIEYGYTPDCADCFIDVSPCMIRSGCLLPCAADSYSNECIECAAEKCDPEQYRCTGFPYNATIHSSITTSKQDLSSNVTVSREESLEKSPSTCNFNQVAPRWYRVYDLTFYGSVRDTLNNNAEIIGIVIIIFSGLWPYAKNLVLLIAWYIPMSTQLRTTMLLWLSRLSKYTLVDVYAVMAVMVLVQLNISVGGKDAVVRTEVRFGILAFLIATLWEFAHIEWVKVLHESKIHESKMYRAGSINDGVMVEGGNNEGKNQEEPKKLSNRQTNSLQYLLTSTMTRGILLVLTLGFFFAGIFNELVSTETINVGGEGEGCKQSFNFLTFSNALINKTSLAEANKTKGQTCFLYLSFLVLALILPIIVHTLQTAFLLIPNKSSDQEQWKNRVRRTAEMLWGFSSIEVFLIGIFVVEYKFEEFVAAIAGEVDKEFINVKTNMGSGFFMLIAYSVVAGLLQFSLMPTLGRNDAIETPEQST